MKSAAERSVIDLVSPRLSSAFWRREPVQNFFICA